MQLPTLPPRTAVTAAATLLLALPLAAAAQGTGGTLRVSVTAAATGEPVEGAEIRVEGSEAGGVTEEDGTAVLRGLPHGRRVVEVSRIGFRPERVEVIVAARRTVHVAVSLEDNPVPVDQMEAEAVSWGELMLDARGFYERQRGSSGVFLTRAEITRRRPRTMAQLLNRYAQVQEVGGRSISTSRRSAGGGCPVAYFVDGMHVEGYDVTALNPSNVEGVEVYRGASSVPPEFNRGTAACGAIVIWTRVN